jgi:hypothetical protein
MGDETFIHHFEPKSKQKLMELHHMASSGILEETEM